MIGRSGRALVLLAIGLLVGCVQAAPGWAENQCAGGGKPRPDEGGIGGTGFQPVAPDDDDSGIGGTGIAANGDTGIIGTITGFASICVGGLEIHYGADSAVEIDDQPADVSQLAVGQVVEVVARGTGDEVSAREIVVHHIVAGPLTGIDADSQTLDVMGQTVQLHRSAGVDAYSIGTFVQVNGLRRADGVIVASLVSGGSGDVVHVTGPVASVAAGLLSISGTQISTAAGVRVAVGEEVRVAGRWDGTQIVSTSIDPRPRVPFAGRVGRVEIEGFASGVRGNRLQVGMFEFDLPSTSRETQFAPDTCVRVHATIRDGRAIVDGIGAVGERPALPGPREGRPPGEENSGGIAPLGVDPMKGHGEGPPHDRHEAMPPRPFDGRSGGAPEPVRPERPDRPVPPQIPDRPARVERPVLPEHPSVPDRPQRPDRPDIPKRP